MWVADQRQGKRNKRDRGEPSLGMTAERAARLTVLGSRLGSLGLGSWVKRQRGYKKALDGGDPNPRMTAVRVARLEALGFVWVLSSEHIRKRKQAASTDENAWEAQLARLVSYKVAHGDCNVPRGWSPNYPGLGSWVYNQWAGKKLLDRGEPSNGITAEWGGWRRSASSGVSRSRSMNKSEPTSR
jgi:hypothetical protein